MEEIKKGLRQRIERYEKEVISLKNEVELKKKELIRVEGLLQSCQTLYSNEGGERNKGGERLEIPMFDDKRFSEMSMTDAAFEVLKEIKKGHAKKITAQIVDGGKAIGGKRPYVTLSASLRQDSRFEKIGKNIFRIRPEVEKR